MITVKDIFDFLNALAPFSSQEEWDNSGLAAGDPESEVTKVLLTLDITAQDVLLAKKCGCELIVSHHPVIFSPVKNMTAGSVPYELIRNGISAVCCHTPLDMAQGGTNDTLLSLLGFCGEAGENPILRFCDVEETSAKALSEHISKRLCADVRYCDTGKKIKRLAVCTGSGCSLLGELGDVDAFITGDASYHSFLDFMQAGISLFAAGHFETEAPVLQPLSEKLKAGFPEIGILISDKKNPIKTTRV